MSVKIVKIDLSDLHKYLDPSKSALDILTAILQNYKVNALVATMRSRSIPDLSMIKDDIEKTTEIITQKLNTIAIAVYDGNQRAIAWVMRE